jgi:hypothetical protein
MIKVGVDRYRRRREVSSDTRAVRMVTKSWASIGSAGVGSPDPSVAGPGSGRGGNMTLVGFRRR